MKNWLTSIGGAVGMGLMWGALWAAVGALKGLLVSPNVMNEPWVGPAIGVFPGFVGGLLFSAVLGLAKGSRELEELSVSQVCAWGGMVALLLGFLPLAINKPPSEFPVWLVAAVVIGSLTLMGAVSAAGSLVLARSVSRVKAAQRN